MHRKAKLLIAYQYVAIPLYWRRKADNDRTCMTYERMQQVINEFVWD